MSPPPPSLPHRDPTNASLTFLDGTPDYMHIPSSACRIATAFPEARIVVLLRDPVARALSQVCAVLLRYMALSQVVPKGEEGEGTCQTGAASIRGRGGGGVSPCGAVGK